MDVVPEDTAAYGKSTVLVGDFDVTADQRQGHKFLMEGVCSDDEVTLRGISGARFVKCRFGDVGFEANHGGLRGCTFIHCYVSNSFHSLYNTTFEAWNSCFKGARMSGNESLFSLRNCVVETADPRNNLSRTTLENCIIINTGEDATAYMNNSSVLYSVWVGPGRENPFPNVPTNYNNSVVREAGQLFRAGTFYQLAAGEGEFIGSDGTEAGLYGGQQPFSPTPSNPQIVKFSVAPQTDAEGKLSIDVEVQ